MKRLPLFAGLALWAVLAAPPVRAALESEMAAHMNVQLPLLGAVGLLLAAAIRPREPRWLAEADWLGIPGIVLAMFTAMFWMLPRMLDMALGDGRFELAKFLSLPLLAGLPLGLAWRRMPPLGRAFVVANAVPMLGTLGALYLAAPRRLCSFYRLDQQIAAGWGLIALAIGLGAIMLLAALVSQPPISPRGATGDRFTPARRAASSRL